MGRSRDAVTQRRKLAEIVLEVQMTLLSQLPILFIELYVIEPANVMAAGHSG